MSPSANERNDPWLAPGRNCWRVETAGRFAVLMENAAYFEALRSALAKAQRSVVMLGWQFDPRTRLDPETAPDDHHAQIGHQLRMMVKARPELDVRLLIWKSPLVIAASQGFFPHRAQSWFRKRMVELRLDRAGPPGTCSTPPSASPAPSRPGPGAVRCARMKSCTSRRSAGRAA